MIQRLIRLTSLFLLAAAPLTGDELTYRFGAKFEPPEGRIIHGMGQWAEENRAYLSLLEDERLYPLTRLHFLDIEPIRPWDMIMEFFKEYLAQEKEGKRIPFVNLELRGTKLSDGERRRLNARDHFGVDDAVADTETYDARIKELAEILRNVGAPVFLRIGAEFNGRWNGYHPHAFPKAFRKIAKIFRMKEADNVAFIWCYEPSAPDDFEDSDKKAGSKWYPGDDVVDWYGIDLFKEQGFTGDYPVFTREEGLSRIRVEKFMRMARKHKKPVMICESSAVDQEIQSPGTWEAWFEPYFSFMRKHPEIKGFVYISARWPRYRKNDPFKWGDARIHLNPDLSSRWIAEIKRKKYLHAGSTHLLKDGLRYNRKKAQRKLRFKQSSR